MKKGLIILAGVSVAALATPAMAQSSDTTFTGPRVEIVTGYDTTRAGSTIDDDSDADNDQSIEGLLYGVGVGYDVDMGSVVIGAEAELSDSTAKTEFNDGDFEGIGIGNVNVNRDLYLGARVGAKVGPNALAYVKGGYTNAKFDVRSRDGSTEFTQDIDADGWRLGAGAEYAVSENAFVKLEYRYSNYQKAEVDFRDDFTDGDRFDIDLDRHQVVAGVGVRF
ncbi:outer membrane protein [Altererythrobacter sp. CAU 1778]